MLERPPTVAFDYDGIDLETRKKLEKKVSVIDKQTVLGTRAFIEIGKQLIEVKALLPHGRFTAWVEANCRFTSHTATNCMNAAQFVAEHRNLAHLDYTAIVALSAPRLEAPVRESVIEAVQAGLTSATAIRARIKLEQKTLTPNGGGSAAADEVDRRLLDLAAILLDHLPEAALERVQSIVAALDGPFEFLSQLLNLPAGEVARSDMTVSGLGVSTPDPLPLLKPKDAR